MARRMVGHCLYFVKFGEILKSRTNASLLLSSNGSIRCLGVHMQFFGSPRAPKIQQNRQNYPLVTLGRRPSLFANCFQSHGTRTTVYCSARTFVWQSKLKTCCDAFLSCRCVFSTSGSAKYGKDGENRNLPDRTRDRFVQTRQKIRETGEKVKEKMEDFGIRRENVLTIPNLLCGARIVLSPILGYLVVQKSFEYALGVFVFAGLTDLLDGFIARNFKNQQSTFGSFLDPLADKFLVFCLVLSLTSSQLLPVPLTVLIIARDACLIGASAYVRYVSLPLPKTWSSYFDVTNATARLSPTLISKFNTLVQLSLLACTLASPVFHLENHPFLSILWYITATTTVASALSYVFSKNTYHILKDLKDKK